MPPSKLKRASPTSKAAPPAQPVPIPKDEFEITVDEGITANTRPNDISFENAVAIPVVEQPAAIVEEEVEEEQGPIESPPYFEPFPTSEELQITKKEEDDIDLSLLISSIPLFAPRDIADEDLKCTSWDVLFTHVARQMKPEIEKRKAAREVQRMKGLGAQETLRGAEGRSGKEEGIFGETKQAAKEGRRKRVAA